jgi:flagellar basal body-associated protein FliL
VKKKLKILVPLVLVLAGGAYKFALAKPVPVKKKIDGTVYVLPKDFVINLQDGRFAKLDVALVLDEPPDASHEAVKPPEGFGPLPQEAVVRDIVTDVLTDSSADDLVSRKGRREIKERILRTIRKTTDVKAGELLLTDVAVQ